MTCTTCTEKHYDCLEQSDCTQCRYDRLMRTLAINLLDEADMPQVESDIQILADDLAKVDYDVKVDGAHKSEYGIQQLFLSRLGGIGALPRYMLCIRPKGTPAFSLTEPPATDWKKLRTKGAR